MYILSVLYVYILSSYTILLFFFKETELDEEALKEVEEPISKTENVLEEHKHEIFENTGSDNENVVHESVIDNLPPISESSYKNSIEDSGEHDDMNKDREQNIDFPKILDDIPPPDSISLEESIQQVS